MNPSRPAALTQSTVQRLRDETKLESDEEKEKTEKKKRKTEKKKNIIRRSPTPVTLPEDSVQSNDLDIQDINTYTPNKSEARGTPVPHDSPYHKWDTRANPFSEYSCHNTQVIVPLIGVPPSRHYCTKNQRMVPPTQDQ